ncbi:DUF4265 domain-containing protein [Pseudoalteromonas arctica]|uniref:DUF4265 domain-containing protein n=1 Tax=Pseudoalteromonas arctica TaxID=394751 RepID=A0A7Y0HEG6_9GAMM|nr:DUF4265 domain-containing protein [Pseudoalteromonas arctica]NMM42159.1 DUF4265 domain-containing protein [Pseudoalteromonas arctica]
MSTVKIDFELDVDADGFPPIAVESLNGILLDSGLIQIDNVPFFIEEIAVGDVVKCFKAPQRKNYQFEEVVYEGTHKSVAILFVNNSEKEEIYQFLKSKGCYCEYGEFGEFNMLAVDINDEVIYEDIEKYLAKLESEGAISYAELCVG